MKFRVHTYQAVRYVYEVEADSAEDAYKLVDRDGWEMEPVEVSDEDREWAPEMVVDPILDSGEVDYENVQHFGWKE